MDWDQLEALKRQLEEDYRLDLAAIERLQRRFRAAGTSAATSNAPVFMPPANEPRRMPEPAPAVEQRSEQQPDELTGTLRAMFSSQRSR